MAYDNINLSKSNFVSVDGYFYTMDNTLSALMVKTADGTQAFSYPLDTPLSTSVASLTHDGINFWSLENTNGSKVVIRRWQTNNYICKIQDTFTLTSGTNDIYGANAFAVEHYHSILTSSITGGIDYSINIQNVSKLNSTYVKKITIGPSSASGFVGLSETISIISSDANSIYLASPPLNNYMSGDPVNYYSNIWLFNNFNGTDSTTGALYKISGYTGMKIGLQLGGGEFQSINAATFFSLPASTFIRDSNNVNYNSTYDTIAFVKNTNILFMNPNDTSNNYGSLAMDNIESDLATVIPIYSISIEDNNIYRLQLMATYLVNGTLSTTTWTTYNYQLSTLIPFITSISLKANPAIIAASGGTNVSTITADVKDQFNLPLSKQVVFTMSPTGVGSFYGNTAPNSNSETGIATVGFNSGNQAAQIVITATAKQG